MTGGTGKTHEINQILASSAQKYNIAMGVGSQRIGIEQKKRMETFNIRKHAPDVFLFANLGAIQTGTLENPIIKGMKIALHFILI